MINQTLAGVSQQRTRVRLQSIGSSGPRPGVRAGIRNMAVTRALHSLNRRRPIFHRRKKVGKIDADDCSRNVHVFCLLQQVGSWSGDTGIHYTRHRDARDEFDFPRPNVRYVVVLMLRPTVQQPGVVVDGASHRPDFGKRRIHGAGRN